MKQHRRTIRTAWAAGILVLLLGVAASVAAVFAFNEQARANQEADRANQEAERANQNAELASQEAERANANAEEAEAQRVAAVAAAEAEAEARVAAERAATVAQAREIVLEAEKAVEVDPELSLHLSLFALDSFLETGEDPARAVTILRNAIAVTRATRRLQGVDVLAAHPTEPLLATLRLGGGVMSVWDATTGEEVESYNVSGSGGGAVAFSADGERLAFWSEEQGVTIWNRESKETTHVDGGGEGLTFSPDGEYLAWQNSSIPTVEIYSLSEQRVVYRFSCCTFSTPDFGPDGLLAHGEGSGQEVVIVDPASGRTVRRLPFRGSGTGIYAWWSPDGSRIAAGIGEELVVIDATTGAELSRHVGDHVSAAWLRTSDALVVGDQAGLAVVDAKTGEVRMELLGLQSRAMTAVSGTGLVAALNFGNRGEIVLFDTFPAGGVEVGGWLTPLADSGWASFLSDGQRVLITDRAASYVVADALDGANSGLIEGPDVLVGDTLLVSGDGSYVASWGVDGVSAVRSSADLSVVYTAPKGWEIQGLNWDASVAVIHSNRLPMCQEAYIVSTEDGAVIADLTPMVSNCVILEDLQRARMYFSPDGAVMSFFGSLHRVSGSLPHFDNLPYQESAPVVFTPDGRLVLSSSPEGRLVAYDFRALRDGAGQEAALEASISAHDDASIVDITVSLDGAMATTSAYGDPLRLWDLTSGRLLGEFGGPLERDQAHYGAFHPTEPWLLVVSPPNEVRIYTLDLEELITIAESRLTRGMTEGECQQYFRSPCSVALGDG